MCRLTCSLFISPSVVQHVTEYEEADKRKFYDQTSEPIHLNANQ